jgi:hypothetical protein
MRYRTDNLNFKKPNALPYRVHDAKKLNYSNRASASRHATKSIFFVSTPSYHSERYHLGRVSSLPYCDTTLLISLKKFNGINLFNHLLYCFGARQVRKLSVLSSTKNSHNPNVTSTAFKTFRLWLIRYRMLTFHM